ncbi:hypothetical protein [Cryptosporangium minutisporangium]
MTSFDRMFIELDEPDYEGTELDFGVFADDRPDDADALVSDWATAETYGAAA